MLIRPAILFIAGSICFGSSGCTYRAWHEGFREQQRHECYKLVSLDAMQKCLDKIDSMTYDQYGEARKDSKQHDE